MAGRRSRRARSTSSSGSSRPSRASRPRSAAGISRRELLGLARRDRWPYGHLSQVVELLLDRFLVRPLEKEGVDCLSERTARQLVMHVDSQRRLLALRRHLIQKGPFHAVLEPACQTGRARVLGDGELLLERHPDGLVDHPKRVADALLALPHVLDTLDVW